jgi:hypothetical protein
MEHSEQQFPNFLKSITDFTQHLEEHFEGMESPARGDSFLHFACRLLPLSEEWSGFSRPQISEKKSHDGGVDFEAPSIDGTSVILGQSKYRIRKVEELDQIFSKFANFESQYFTDGNELLLFKEFGPKKPSPRYLVVTSSKLDNIRSKFESSRLSSKDFYNQLKREKRLVVIDGPKLLTALQQIYRRSFILPPSVTVELQAPYIHSGNTYISIINGLTLRELYEKHGSSLFFENIREFLGMSSDSPGERDSVNDDITNTLQHAPDKMLERNNGITIKAESLTPLSDKRVRLDNCSIINGCQTTVCVALSGDGVANANLLLKIVVSSDSWDVAKAANHQNSVTRIDLDLARFLRPQLVRKVATETGYGMPQHYENNASNILEAIYSQKISYEEVRLLCLGLFSRFPNNIFSSNYVELRIDILREIEQADKAEQLLTIMFRLLAAMRDASNMTRRVFSQEEYADLFKRFFREDNAKYRCFLAILTACGCVGDWLGDKKPEAKEELGRLLSFLSDLEKVLASNTGYFERTFQLAFEILAEKALDISAEGRDAEILQKMYREISGSNFRTFFRKLRMRMDGDPEIARLRPSSSRSGPQPKPV